MTMGSFQEKRYRSVSPAEGNNMPQMYEIYEKHAIQYHELIRAEDASGNLWKTLEKSVAWQDISVLEAGVGTGRLPKLYLEHVAHAVCCDRAQHMLDFAKKNLASYQDKIQFLLADNLDLSAAVGNFDLFVEGWSFGHVVSDCSTTEEIPGVTEQLIRQATRKLKPGASVIVIETLGTNVDHPQAPSPHLQAFYSALELHHGFQRQEIQTDYQFESMEDAVRIMGFFFGEEMGQAVRIRNSTCVPEWTGIWIKNYQK
jgi:ubiquinone/menaquinone biosynthesis C-methylase UbiE